MESNENAHIELDVSPLAIGVIRDRIYVTSVPSNSTSVIEATNSSKIANIEVGKGPGVGWHDNLKVQTSQLQTCFC